MMQWIEVTDENQANKYKFKRYQGRPFHITTVGNVGDQLRKFKELNCWEDDVIICSFPRSGSHWVYNTIQMLRSGTLTYSGTPRVADFEDLNHIEHMETPRTFLTHFTFPLIPTEAKEGVPKVVFVSRNPKDVLVSDYHLFQKMSNTGFRGDFDFFMKFFLSDKFFASGGSWFTYMKEWKDGRKQYPNMRVFSIRYEDFKKDTFDTIGKLADFLEIRRDQSFLQKVEENISFERLKMGHTKVTDDEERWSMLDKQGRMPIYRKGEVGDWKNMFTVAQNEFFNAMYDEKMEGYDLEIVYE